MSRRPDRPLLSVGLMLAAVASFAAMQAAVKVGRQHGLGTAEVMLYRTAPGLPLLWWALRRRGHGLWPSHPRDVLTRSVFGTLAMGTNFASIAGLSLLQFATLGLLHPVFVAVASPLLLGERPRPHVWLALPLAASGALVLIRPGAETATMPFVPALLGLASAGFSALAQMWVRKATQHEPAERVVFHFAALVSVVATVDVLARQGGFHVPAAIGPLSLAALVAAMAGFGTLGQVLMTRAYSVGEAAPVSIVGYSGVAMGMVADLALWGVLPTPSALAGAAIMVTAGILLVRGER